MTRKLEYKMLEESYLIKELIKQFNVDEHRRGICKFVGDNVQESFWTENFALGASTTSLRLQRK